MISDLENVEDTLLDLENACDPAGELAALDAASTTKLRAVLPLVRQLVGRLLQKADGLGGEPGDGPGADGAAEDKILTRTPLHIRMVGYWRGEDHSAVSLDDKGVLRRRPASGEWAQIRQHCTEREAQEVVDQLKVRYFRVGVPRAAGAAREAS